ncbi:hypothetical protein DSO57_1003718 [Entomophthora muscae]|uniref:Uncharacterized protein n=1 Tax=Entomophthora muscae TaxID=34485 RepID=A0ACC2SXC8_9FUNG|nr:hypothetical protein DSO57_1003718 [Entomophthora muscae]
MGNSSLDTGYKCEQELLLTIGHNKYLSSLILHAGLPHPLILGDSWSDKHGLILNYHKQTTTLGQPRSCDTILFGTNQDRSPANKLLAMKLEPSVGILPTCHSSVIFAWDKLPKEEEWEQESGKTLESIG